MPTFEDIYKAHNNRVYNLALQYVQNIEDAQEITQDVFMIIHNSIDKFREASSLSTWIYRITINKSLDHIKAKKRKKRLGFLSNLFYDDSNDVKHENPTFDHPGVLMEQKEALESIFNQLNELPPNQRTALILNKLEQRSHTEIADIMQLSTKAVESLVQRGKSNLSKKINENEGK